MAGMKNPIGDPLLWQLRPERHLPLPRVGGGTPPKFGLGLFMECSLHYSEPSANGHCRKRTALLTDAFSNPRFTSQSNSVFTHSRKRTLFRKRTRTRLEMKIGFFFCLRSLVRGHPIYNNRLLAINLALLFNKSINIHCSLKEHQNSGDRLCQISICSGEICYFWLPNKI